MADVDYFKLYNDYYGHQAGDRCLQQVAQAISKTVNPSEKYGISDSRSFSSASQIVDKSREKGTHNGDAAHSSKSDISPIRSDDKDHEAKKASEIHSGSDAETFAPPTDKISVNEKKRGETTCRRPE